MSAAIDYEDKAGDLLELARLELEKLAPYMSAIQYKLVPVFVVGLNTLGVSKDCILSVDPIRVVDDPELSDPETLAGVLFHECWHVQEHMERIEVLLQQGEDENLVTLAADLAINGPLQQAGVKLPSWGAFPGSYGYPDGETLEQYLERLKADAKKVYRLMGSPPGSGDGDDQGQGGKSSSKQKGQGGKDGMRWDICSGVSGSAGGGASNDPVEDELKSRGLGRSKDEVQSAREEVVHAVREHVEQQGRGSVPGHLKQLLDSVPKKKSKNDWKRTLSRIVRRASGIAISGGSDFSLRRPSKRSLLRGILRPGMIDQQWVPCLIRDTSGSMGTKQLHEANNEAIALMEQTGVEQVWWADADTQQYGFKLVRLKDIPRLDPVGRGGTSFIEPLARAAKLKPRPDVIIYLTDGDGSAPDKPPKGIPVIWCIVPSRWRSKPADWGHIVICTEEQSVVDEFE